jgi:hypothetical protein
MVTSLFDRRGACVRAVLAPASWKKVLYAHGEMYGLVTVTQGSRYMSNAVTHPRCIFWTANFTKAAQIGPKSGFSGGFVCMSNVLSDQTCII